MSEANPMKRKRGSASHARESLELTIILRKEQGHRLTALFSGSTSWEGIPDGFV
jgi:hypothetical protein